MMMGGKERVATRQREVRVESGEERNEKFFFRVESEAWREIERQKEFFFFVRKRKKEINKII